jgi:HEPN domain-containing protein
MKSRSEAFLEEAKKKLQVAKEEMFKPEEDMVSYSVCKNSQIAIENYLKGYLTQNNIELSKNETINTLFNKCIAFNEKFKEVDLSEISCSNHIIDSRYCSEIQKVSACLDTADALDTYFRRNKII